MTSPFKTHPELIGFDSPSPSKIPAYLKEIESLSIDKPVTISFTLASAEAYRPFRKKLVEQYIIRRLETSFGVLEGSRIGGVVVTREKKSKADKDKYPVIFRHFTNLREAMRNAVREFTVEVTTADLAESLLSSYHLPERTEFLKKLKAKPILAVGDIFTITGGLNLQMAAKRLQASSTMKGRLVTVSHLSQTRYIRNTFSSKVEDMPITRGLKHLELGDILMSTLATNNPAQTYAMVVSSRMLDAFPIHTILRLTVKDKVDPRLAKVFFALWGWDKYRLLYPFIPSDISMIHVSRLLKLPVLVEEQAVAHIAGNVSRLIKIDDERLAIEHELEGVV